MLKHALRNLPEGRISVSLGYDLSQYMARAGDNTRRGVGLAENQDIIEKLPQTQLADGEESNDASRFILTIYHGGYKSREI